MFTETLVANVHLILSYQLHFALSSVLTLLNKYLVYCLPPSLPNLASVSCAFGVLYVCLSRGFPPVPRINLAFFHVFSICCSKASKASAFKDFCVMKVLSSFEIAF